MLHYHHHPPGILPAVQSLLYIVIVAMFAFAFVVEPSRIPSASMEPTLLIGDSLLVDKQAFSAPAFLDPLPHRPIARGDIIVFHFPVEPARRLIKRVVGLPGDRIHLHDNRVYINGIVLAEPYAFYLPAAHDIFRDDFPSLQRTNPSVNARWWIQMRRLLGDGTEITVPAGQYFVLGDNRNDSEDSRYWGFVPQSYIVGRPLFVYFSLRQSQDPGPGQPATAFVRPMLSVLAHLARWDRIGHIIR